MLLLFHFVETVRLLALNVGHQFQNIASVRTQPCRLEMIEALYKPLEDGNDDGMYHQVIGLIYVQNVLLKIC